MKTVSFVGLLFVLFLFVVAGCGGGGGGVTGVGPNSNNLGIAVPIGSASAPVLPTPVGNVLMSLGAEGHPTDGANVFDRRVQLWNPVLKADMHELQLTVGKIYEFVVFPRFQEVEGQPGPTVVRNLKIRATLPTQFEFVGSRMDATRGFFWGYDIPIGYFGAEQLAQGVNFGDARIYPDKVPSLEFHVRPTATPVGPMVIELTSDNFPSHQIQITF
ncbi:hypothetical protein HYZ64_00825 [Candidatus Berkelbacteria bacterium]|nr:hypothetical protein [Candidatus Berkelbacteria bacterium]